MHLGLFNGTNLLLHLSNLSLQLQNFLGFAHLDRLSLVDLRLRRNAGRVLPGSLDLHSPNL